MCNLDIAEDWMLFVAAAHLNADPSSRSDFLFQLNHRAADKAASVAAFESAGRFLKFALDFELLCQEDNPWEADYDRTMSTYKKLAGVLLAQGDHDGGESAAQILFLNAKTMEAKLPTLVALAASLGTQQKHKESLALSQTALRKLNEYPKGKVGMMAAIAVDLQAIKRYLKSHDDNDILKLPLLASERQLRVMELLHSLSLIHI